MWTELYKRNGREVCSCHSEHSTHYTRPINHKFTVKKCSHRIRYRYRIRCKRNFSVWIKAKRHLFPLWAPLSKQLLQARLAEGVLAVQGAWSLAGRPLTIPTETYLARQFVVVAFGTLLLLLLPLLMLMMMPAIQLTIHHWTHFATILST